MLTQPEVVRILSHYDLGELRTFTTAMRGYVNQTAFIQTDEGSFVLRRSHRRLNEESQRYRHRLINTLTAHNFPVPALMPTRTGDTLLTLDGRYCELMEFIPGIDYDYDNLSHVASVGETLAWYHTLTEDMPPPPDETPPRYIPENNLRLIEKVLERDVMGDLHEHLNWYDLRAARLRKRLNESTYRALPHLVIHGDIHRDNFIFAGDRLAALLDYDQSAWETPVCDLADALVAFASLPRSKNSLINTWGVFQGTLNLEYADCLLGAYLHLRPLSNQEIAMLPTILEVLWLHGELGRVVSTPEGAPEYHISVLEQGQQLAGWLDKNKDQLVERWQQLNREAVAAEEEASELFPSAA